MSARRLIVSGDDFGAAPEVNAGIARAHHEGILTSTSLMVAGAAVGDAVAIARAAPRLSVGLHLVLAQDRPVLGAEQISRLVRRSDGRFGDQPVLSGLRYGWVWCSRVGRAQLRAEIAAQLERFAATGLRLAHVDGHLNMHLHPMVLPMLCELAGEFGIRVVRLTREEVVPALRYDRRHAVRKAFEATIFRTLSALAAPRLARAGIRTVDRIFGMHQTGHVDERYLLWLLPRLPAGVSELYCHPAERQAAGLARYQAGYDHAGEVAALTSPRVREVVRAEGIELVATADLPRLG